MLSQVPQFFGRLRPYAICLAAVAVASALQLFLADALPAGAPYSPHYLSVAVSAFVAGAVPALLVLTLSAFIGTFLSASSANEAALLLYLLNGSVFCALAFWLEKRSAGLLAENPCPVIKLRRTGETAAANDAGAKLLYFMRSSGDLARLQTATEQSTFEIDAGGKYYAATIKRRDGEVTIYAQDITNEKTLERQFSRASTELQQKQRWLETVLGAVNDEVWMFNKDGGILQTNVQRLNAVPPLTANHPALAAALKGERIDSEETQINGTDNWRSCRTLPVEDEERGEILGAVASVRDSTVQKLAEREAERRQRELQELAGGVFDTAVSIKDLEGRYVLTNSYLEKLHGLTSSEFLGKTELEISSLERAELVARHERSAVAERSALDFEESFPAADGKKHILKSRVLPLIGRGDKVYGICTVSADITAEVRLQKELQQARKEAAAAAQAKEQLISVLSHELRTPLTPVLTSLALMQRDYPDLSERLSVIRRNVELEARLIDDLLDLTKLARGQVALKKERIDLRSILDQVIEMCSADIESKLIRFHAQLAETIPLEGDVPRLQQVFWNILRNAVKFTPPGGCIGVRSSIDDGHAVTEVYDSGIGIDAGSAQRIFDAFEQGDITITRKFGGAGLGLPIAKRLVEMHGGYITAQSHGMGSGSVFRIGLPQSLTAEAAKSSEAPKGDKFPVRILLVEDHKDTAQLICMLLESAGYKVEVAGSVSTALDMAHEKEFDVLVSDLGLPDRSGLDLMRELRREGRQLRGIAVSGFGCDEDLDRSKDAGFVEHLVKPVDLEQLTRAVERAAHI